MNDLENLTSLEEYLVADATAKEIPIGGTFELLPICNMNCNMCYVRLDYKTVIEKGGILPVEKWIDYANQLKELGLLFILLTGGEPLLYPNFKELYLALQDMGMFVTINTNGTLINEEWADFFARHVPRKINITVYGKDESSYEQLCHYQGYHKTIQAIKLLKQRNIPVKINGSIVKENSNDYDALLQIANELDCYCELDTYMFPSTRERGLPYSYQSRLTPEEAAQIHFNIMKKQYDDNTFIDISKKYLVQINKGECNECRAGKSSFFINWQGNMRACVMLNYPSTQIDTIEDAWEIIKKQTKDLSKMVNCKKCKYRSMCKVCMASCYLETGNFNGKPDYLCEYTEESVNLLKEYLDEKKI